MEAYYHPGVIFGIKKRRFKPLFCIAYIVDKDSFTVAAKKTDSGFLQSVVDKLLGSITMNRFGCTFHGSFDEAMIEVAKRLAASEAIS